VLAKTGGTLPSRFQQLMLMLRSEFAPLKLRKGSVVNLFLEDVVLQTALSRTAQLLVDYLFF
jgi:hypothetical protein